MWNPLLKKAFKNLPEERVRLQILEFLLRDAGWPAARISCEVPIRDKTYSDNTLRADLICYDRNFKPAILIECKAPNIRLTEKTAFQIAGYNRKIKAPHLFLTNGIRDMFFEVDNQTANAIPVDLEKIFPDINAGSDSKSLKYFLERGFAGEKTSPEIRSWLVYALPEFLKLSSRETRFLDLGETPEKEPISHYYHIFHIDKKKKLAITFIATRYGDTRIIAVLNDGGINKGILEINLELILKKELYSTILYHSQGTRKIDLSDLFDFSSFKKDQLRELPKRVSERLSS
ncbi:MAG: type I restriction enzyme HsdR N-terminal domain-containing protein [Balneolales bacterium]